MFDVTFLPQPLACIYGHGCQGVLTGPAPELEQGCCSYGAHFVDEDDANAVLERGRAAHHRPVAAPAGWRPARRAHPARPARASCITRLVDGACIFLNRPGFRRRRRLRPPPRARSRPASGPIDWKPDVCWQLPLRLVDSTDDSGQVISTLREWKRRDWGAGGHEFHWWCTEAPDAFVGASPSTYAARRDRGAGGYVGVRPVRRARHRPQRRQPPREQYVPAPSD